MNLNERHFIRRGEHLMQLYGYDDFIVVPALATWLKYHLKLEGIK